MAGIAEHFEVGSCIVRAIAILMMHEQSALRTTSVACSKFHKFSVVPFKPATFRYPIAVAFFRYSLCLQAVSAVCRACNRWFSKQCKTDYARLYCAAPAPVRILRAAPVSHGQCIGFSSPINYAHAMARTKSATSVSYSRRKLEECFPAFETSTFDLWHGCSLSCMGHC